MKAACGHAHMKSILAIGELGSMNNVYKVSQLLELLETCQSLSVRLMVLVMVKCLQFPVQCSLVCMMAGSDFIKTSTGKEGVNATLAVGLVMCRAIREYQDVTGFRVGFKPAGGIRSETRTE